MLILTIGIVSDLFLAAIELAITNFEVFQFITVGIVSVIACSILGCEGFDKSEVIPNLASTVCTISKCGLVLYAYRSNPIVISLFAEAILLLMSCLVYRVRCFAEEPAIE